MKKIAFLTFLVVAFIAGNSQNYRLKSPNEKLDAEIEIAPKIIVKIKSKGETVLSLTDLSMDILGKVPSSAGYTVKKVIRNSVNETIKPVIREKSAMVQNHYNELIIDFKSGQSLTFRLFDEGLAYRISTNQKDSLIILKENLTIQLDVTDSIRFQASKSFSSAWETPYEFKKLAEVEKDELLNLPVLIEKQNGMFVLITESDLFNFPGLWAQGTGTSEIATTHAPFPKKLSYKGSIYGHGQIAETENFVAKVAGTRNYPWRIFAVEENEEGLISNNMVYLLSPPTAITDVSWINPGVVMFDWWAKNNVFGVDFKTGVNTEMAKYFIDFCAEKGFRYFLFDDGWCPKENLLKEVDGLNIPEVTAYAKEKGVDVMLWVIWSSLQKQWDTAFDQFEKWGIKGIKMDFMNRDDQQMVEFYEAVAKKAAEKKMVVNFHGAYKPSGLNRKYPNVLTREALIEFEYNGWTESDNPEHHNLLPYIRMFTGAMDYIPATMRNSNKHNFRPISDYPMGQGTRAHAMALFVILSSPMTMLPDSPSDYYREKECTDFLTKIPVEWDETRLLQGDISKYTVLSRRSGESWFVGAITNDDERSVELKTDFLKPGKYRIEWIEDGINAGTRASDYQLIEKEITAGEILHLKMAPGGGWLAHIRPL